MASTIPRINSRVVELDPPDSHHLLAAVGWLELGNPAESLLEFKRISPANQSHPDVLEVKWTVHSQLKNWETCIELARELTRVASDRPFGWIHLSYALHELKRTQEAYDNLITILKYFPDEWLMDYNLACYACQLGRPLEAERWLAEAMSKGDKKEIQKMAKSDPDLTPLFEGK